MTIDLRLGNVMDVLRTMDAESVHTIVTSPPYWGLRAYGTEPQVWQNGHDLCVEHEWETREHNPQPHGDDGYSPSSTLGGGKGTQAQTRMGVVKHDTCTRCGCWRGELGLEPQPELYVDHIVLIMREARRVLRDDGVMWINLGDSYASGKGTCFNPGGGEHSLGKEHKDIHPLDRGNKSTLAASGLKPKDLVGIPWRVAFALQADGWYLRSDIIWHKPNPMPESVRDRPTKAHEYMFLLAKQPKYYYDAEAVREPQIVASAEERARRNGKRPHKHAGEMFSETKAGLNDTTWNPAGRNRRSVWTVTTQPFSGARLLADYVSENGIPYRASPDCPIHGHLARFQTSCTLSDDGQQAESESHIPDSDDGHDQECACESKSKIYHSHAGGLGDSVRGQIHPDTCDCKTLDDQSAHISGARNPDHSLHTLESHAPLGHKTDSACQQCESPASGHNKRKSKSARARHISERDSVSAQTLFDTHRTLQSDAQTDSAGHTYESNSAVDSVSSETTQGLSEQTTCHNADTCIPSDTSASIICKCEKVSIDHFATFPPKLIEPCILASTSERGVCRKCGAPWVRVAEKGKTMWETRKAEGATMGGHIHDSNGQYQRGVTRGLNGKRHADWKAEHPDNFVGWRASCDCDAGEPVPATVLDPFNGAGTTGLVAVQHGRNYIGIDLKPEYLEMSRKRLDGVQMVAA